MMKKGTKANEKQQCQCCNAPDPDLNGVEDQPDFHHFKAITIPNGLVCDDYMVPSQDFTQCLEVTCEANEILEKDGTCTSCPAD